MAHLQPNPETNVFSCAIRSCPRACSAWKRSLLETWREEDLFQKTLEKTAEGEPFVFFEGPPTANGKPGLHHIISRTLKDLVCRHQTMKGRYVTRIAGWDTHGLPVEIEAERRLGISGKPEIEKLGNRAVQRGLQGIGLHLQGGMGGAFRADRLLARLLPSLRDLPYRSTSSRSGGFSRSWRRRASCTGATRAFPTAPGVAPPSPPTRWPRGTRTSRTPPSSSSARSWARTESRTLRGGPSWCGPRRPGPFRPMWGWPSTRISGTWR